MKLLENQTTDTDGSQAVVEGRGANFLVQVEGTFDGATVTLEGSLEGMGFQQLKDVTGSLVAIIVDDTVVITYCKAGFRIRAAVIGAGGSTNITVAIAP
jgi:hypothetical protein